MIILTTIRPAHSNDPGETSCFNWDNEVHLEKQRAGKFIADALYRNNTVLSRRISARLPQHSKVLDLPADYYTRLRETVAS